MKPYVARALIVKIRRMCVTNEFWWYCPKCRNKVSFNRVVETLFDDDGEAWFEPDSGVPFYILKCSGKECGATWNIEISEMYEE